MAPWLRLAALPSSLIALITNSILPVSSQDLNWPYNLPPDTKYYPEDEFLIKRGLDIQQRLQRGSPTGVRKMSGDPGEKFYLEYWGFDQEEDMNNYSSWTNASFTSFDQPVRVQTHRSSPRLFRRLSGWHLFQTRDFQCPAGTSACASIDRPNSCCATGSTCQLVQDTGLGDVGCCPNGQTCADSLSTCADEYTSCPNNPGGGCCMPGYACYDVGCIQTSTATILTAPRASTTTVTSYTTITPSAPPPPTTTSTTTSSTSPSNTSTLPPQISTVTRTVTVTSSAPTTLTCSPGFRSCSASLGGGCCPTDRQCGSANCPASPSSTSATPEPPVRPTSLTTTVETTTATPTSASTPVSGCPTGFYACSAYYQGGCCQIGRDCASTSCPTSASTTLVSGSTLTIVAPTGSGITAPGTVLTGSCAHGWATCAPSLGGGCCPSGYACGSVSCNAGPEVTGGEGVGKMAPSTAGRNRPRPEIWMLGFLCALLSSGLGAFGF